MKKLFVLFFVFLATLGRADEGMWLPLLIDRLNYVDMQKEGLKLTAEEIYSINHSSLKDAIIQFGNGCTGEMISSQGLVLTNHHCGYGAIQSHSTIEHDYLADGFWAMNLKEELPNEGLTARFLVRIEDVTARVLEGLNDQMTERERNAKISELSKAIQSEATQGTGYDARVASFFNGNEFYLFVYEVFRDVRLVGAPPSSIGKFGADTDNWLWPRHTGDFSLFRVYTGPDGKPASFSDENIPMKPRHHLPVSLDGYEKGDFAMIMGYPGSTDRYLTSWGVNLAIEISNPTIVKIRGKKLDIMRKDMDANREVAIKYASKYAGVSNYWKYFIGQTRGLKRLKVLEDKQKIENEFQVWVNADPVRMEKYGKVLSDIEAAYKTYGEYTLQRWYFIESVMRGAEVMTLAQSFTGLGNELGEKAPSQEKIDRMKQALTKSVERHFKNYNRPTDVKLLSAMLQMYYENVPVQQQPEAFRQMVAKNKGDFNRIAGNIFARSIFADEAKVRAFLEKPSLKVLKKDPAYTLSVMMVEKYRENQKNLDAANEMLERGNRLFVAGLREMQPERKFYPNANSTMRLTYGKVLDYYPADAVHYNYFTTLKGVMEKEDPDNWEFVVPAKLKALYEKKDFGPYAMDNGQMPVAFLSTTDITGGNSGSPVINGKGELIGLAFDGNWEAMSGDIAFEPELQRTISVDIRYVLFIIDKYAGAKNIINELTLVPKGRKAEKEISSDGMPVDVRPEN
ncbi:peptidase S46 [Lentimicrobium saccharophilum]|uniref:Dipeptidyl-peptidase n=1 Tax=Lentimicrobium saccharophilum TaxID=1678841 RepID=A0A0S7BSA7_9BACT|nr:S46 family peptidase [Lentimicrobium saccharophilum]GAP43813.1 peptidase S46 [Lentimicrobium saccharophilum]